MIDHSPPSPLRTPVAVVLGLLAMVFAANLSGAQSPSPTELAWVGLFNPAMIEWLENSNRLKDVCGLSEPGSDAFERCRAEKMAARIFVIRLFSRPSIAAPSAGAVLLLAAPASGEGLRAFFVSEEGGQAAPLVPDLFDPDYGYGPYFHETFLERRGNWFLLPEGPFKKGTWLNGDDLGAEVQVQPLEIETIVTSPQGDLFVLGMEPGFLRARPEQPSDMWCRVGPAPPLQPFKELRIPFGQLYSSTGHLLLHKKYTRGC